MAELRQETWVNQNKGRVYIARTRPDGTRRSFAAEPGRKFNITEEDRVMAQGVVAHSSMDPFTNGTLSLVSGIVKDSQGYEEISDNLMTKTIDELRDLFDLPTPQLRKELAKIENPQMIERIRQLAEDESEDESSSLTAAKKKAVDDRHKELFPKVKKLETGDELYKKEVMLP